MSANEDQSLAALKSYFGGEFLHLLEDQDVSELYCNADLRLRTDGRRGRTDTGFTLNPFSLQSAFRAIAVRAGQDLDETHPIGDFQMPPALGGGRLHVTLPPVTRGVCFNLRKPAVRLLLLDELVGLGALSSAAAAYLKQQIADHRSFLVAGPTNSGKTNLLNALLHVAVDANPPNTRFIVLEDVPEIVCPAPDTKYSRTTEGVTLWHLVRATMRSSPDLIVVGEIRGDEAYPFLDIASSGHGGVLASIHAETPLGALNRLNRLARRGDPDVPDQRELISEVIQTVVCLTGGSQGRRVSHIAQISGWNPSSGFHLIHPLAQEASMKGEP